MSRIPGIDFLDAVDLRSPVDPLRLNLVLSSYNDAATYTPPARLVPLLPDLSIMLFLNKHLVLLP